MCELTAQCIYDHASLLGEGPVWHPQRRQLLWVDIMGCVVHCYDPHSGVDRRFPTPSHVGTVVPRADGQAVVALVDGFYAFSLDDGSCNLICHVEEDLVQNRFNDGKCDPLGRFWCGSMNYDCSSQSAGLYRFDGRLHQERSQVTISNGLGWSPDGSTMYYIDTPTGRCEAMDYDLASGGCGASRVCVDDFPAGGHPDGLCVDTNGMLWIALWGLGRVDCYNPLTGERLVTVRVPEALCTSACCLHDGSIYITSAGGDKRNEQGRLAGSLFACAVDAEGLAPGVFPT